jgi:Viral BACON domain
MRTCQFCAAEVPDNAEFCGSCGQLAQSAAGMTHVHGPMHRVVLTEEQTHQNDAPTALTQWSEQREALINARTGPMKVEEDEEDEEEKRRRLALVNFSLPLLADSARDLPTANLPTAQGTPQATDAPTAAGTPPVVVNNPPMTPPVTSPPLVLPPPQIPVRPPGGIYGTRLPHRPGPTLTGKPQPQPAPGCALWLIIVLVVPLVILASIIGAGLTILAPSLSMQGSADVTPGGALHLHGSHFIPGNTVTCTLDGSTVLPFATTAHPVTAATTSAASLALVIQNDTTLQTTRQATSTTIIVNSDGTFNASFTVEPSWSTGQHTIQATEAFSPRSASVTFTVSGAGQQTATPGATGTAMASATPTPPVTPTTTPTNTGLSAISPETVMLGPIGEGNNQAVTSQVTLSGGGNDLINWTATWDKAQAPWLQLNPQSGQIQAPGTQNITVGALAGSLQAGTYKATITFSNNAQSGQSVTLNVSLTVQAGCLTVTPTTLNFAGTVDANDPPSQTISLNNCGARGNWSATGGAPWLNVTPTNGNLNAGATQNVVVSTSIAGAGSKAGTYRSQIQFTNGTAHATIAVTFVVKAAPVPARLSANATTLTTRLNCKLQQVAKGVLWRCPITLSSSANATSNLNWTSTSSGIAGISTQPASGTLTPGQSAAVEIDIPRFPCGNTGVATFFGPVNNVTVTVSC